MINSTLCYIEKDGKYLMLHRVKKENDVNRDKWIGIGGKFEDGESPEECVLREVKEETALTLNSWRYQAVITFVSDKWETEYMHLFWSDDFSGEVRECDEGNLEWLDKKLLFLLPIWEGDKIFLRLMDEKPPFFSLKLRYEGERLADAVLDGKPYKHKPLRAAVKRAADKAPPKPITPPEPAATPEPKIVPAYFYGEDEESPFVREWKEFISCFQGKFMVALLVFVILVLIYYIIEWHLNPFLNPFK